MYYAKKNQYKPIDMNQQPQNYYQVNKPPDLLEVVQRKKN